MMVTEHKFMVLLIPSQLKNVFVCVCARSTCFSSQTVWGLLSAKSSEDTYHCPHTSKRGKEMVQKE